MKKTVFLAIMALVSLPTFGQRVIDRITYNNVKYEVVEVDLKADLGIDPSNITHQGVIDTAEAHGLKRVPFGVASGWGMKHNKQWLKWDGHSWVVGSVPFTGGPQPNMEYVYVLEPLCKACLFPTGRSMEDKKYNARWFAGDLPWVFLRKARASF